MPRRPKDIQKQPGITDRIVAAMNPEERYTVSEMLALVDVKVAGSNRWAQGIVKFLLTRRAIQTAGCKETRGGGWMINAYRLQPAVEQEKTE